MASAKRYFSSTRIAMLALFSALAALLYILNFSLPFFPGFLEFRFSDIPVLIGTFVLGPVSGCIIVVMMVLLKLVIVSTSTFFVGDLADILVGVALVLPVGLVYDRMRTLKGALLGMGLGTLISTALAVFLNRFLLVPAYVALMFDGSWEPRAPSTNSTSGCVPKRSARRKRRKSAPSLRSPCSPPSPSCSSGLRFCISS